MVSEEERCKHESSERKPSPPKSRISVIVRVLRGLKRRADRYRSQAQQTESEHIVNERTMARWTRVVGIFTIVMASISVISAVISYFALSEMMSSSKQTDRLVDAAVSQADVMKRQQETTMIQLRANIRREGAVANAVMAGGEKVGWKLNSVLRNVGGTDATDFFMIWAIFPDQPKTPEGRTCPIIIKPLDRRFPMVMTPGQPVTQAAIMLRMEDAIRAKQGTRDVYIVGRVEYRDVFKDTKTHNYAWCIHVIPHDLEKDEFSFINVSEERD